MAKKVWIATYGNGIFKLEDGNAVGFKKQDGLFSDFCYSLDADNNGNLWVGHHGGISRLDIPTGSIRLFDRNYGISNHCNPNAISIDEDQNVWFGTESGLLRYDPSKDIKNRVAPAVDITAIEVFDTNVDPASSIDLPADVYKIKFEFLGISLKNSNEVTYQYKLEGHDLDWSEPTTDRQAVYSRINPGSYVFKLRACNSDGFCTQKDLLLPINIQLPFWQKWWFISVSAIAAILILIFIIKRRERNQRKLQEYLQDTLDERTKEVQAKSAEIAKKNKDITDSLSYAKHIQEAILPEHDKLKELFPESFIFHQPRDIVSGDFYWFKRFGQKFVIACADATGHGVPGAFMSMIGSILLRDLSTMHDIDSPDKMLDLLDSEVRALLKQRNDGVTSNDGMDITVCEIDLESRVLRTASAMHSIFLSRNGSIERVKGDRHSIGGFKLNGTPLRFSLQEHQLEPGDKIYLFSDGLPDQFGGLAGKKLKIKGALDLLGEVTHCTMDEQADLLRNKFKSWMNGFEQVDDVLLIGIQV